MQVNDDSNRILEILKRHGPIMLYSILKAYGPSGVTGKLRRQIKHAW
ncbi:hypothetical protein J7M07_09590 [bacterium]|nr:hypothetical protein [bacterium]